MPIKRLLACLSISIIILHTTAIASDLWEQRIAHDEPYIISPSGALRLTAKQLTTIDSLEDLMAKLEIDDSSVIISLDLSHNHFTELPEWLSELSNTLKTLDASYNQLTELPSWIGTFPELGNLNLSHNLLTELPKSFGSLSKVRKLYLNNNRLETLPESFGLLVLGQLWLDNNQLTDLPESFGTNPGLLILHLRFNKLKNVPASLQNLLDPQPYLSELDLSGNELASLPDWLWKFHALTYLNLSDNFLIENLFIPESELYFIAAKLTRLHLDRLQLDQLPEWLVECKELCELSLCDNLLTDLPEWLSQLTKLARLYLDRNQFSQLPEVIKELTILWELSSSNNQLTDVPEWLGELERLRMLNLSNNLLTNLPASFGALECLWELDLSGNQLTKLPEEFVGLKRVSKLDLSRNQLSGLPKLFLRDSFESIANNIFPPSDRYVNLMYNPFGEFDPDGTVSIKYILHRIVGRKIVSLICKLESELKLRLIYALRNNSLNISLALEELLEALEPSQLDQLYQIFSSLIWENTEKEDLALQDLRDALQLYDRLNTLSMAGRLHLVNPLLVANPGDDKEKSILHLPNGVRDMIFAEAGLFIYLDKLDEIRKTVDNENI